MRMMLYAYPICGFLGFFSRLHIALRNKYTLFLQCEALAWVLHFSSAVTVLPTT
jgi:hypothetical protein